MPASAATVASALANAFERLGLASPVAWAAPGGAHKLSLRGPDGMSSSTATVRPMTANGVPGFEVSPEEDPSRMAIRFWFPESGGVDRTAAECARDVLGVKLPRSSSPPGAACPGRTGTPRRPS